MARAESRLGLHGQRVGTPADPQSQAFEAAASTYADWRIGLTKDGFRKESERRAGFPAHAG